MKKVISLIMIVMFFLSQNPTQLLAQQILTAIVTSVSGNTIEIDKGKENGVGKDSEGVVYYMQSVGGRAVKIEVAQARVVSVTGKTSRMEIVESSADVVKGYMVDLEVIAQPPSEVPAKEPETIEKETEKIKKELETVEKKPKKSKKKWYILAGIVIAGGAVAAVAAGGGDSSSEKGTAVIDITFPD